MRILFRVKFFPYTFFLEKIDSNPHMRLLSSTSGFLRGVRVRWGGGIGNRFFSLSSKIENENIGEVNTKPVHDSSEPLVMLRGKSNTKVKNPVMSTSEHIPRGSHTELQPSSALSNLLSYLRSDWTTPPNPYKIRILTQYSAESHDFSWFASPKYDVELIMVHLDTFAHVVRDLPRDAVILNLIDSGHENKKKGVLSARKAINLYETYGHAYTGASPWNVPLAKTCLKCHGVNTPRYFIIKNRNIENILTLKDFTGDPPKRGTRVQSASTPQFIFAIQKFRLLHQQGGTRLNSKKNANRSKTNTIDRAEVVGQKLRFPLIVKPYNDYGASKYIRKESKVYDLDTLKKIVDSYPEPNMLCEEFIEGREYSTFLYERKPKNWLRETDWEKLVRSLIDRIRKNKQRKKYTSITIPSTKIVHVLRSNLFLGDEKEEIPELDDAKKKKRQHSPVRVLDPIEIKFPPGETFQHEDLKWKTSKHMDCEDWLQEVGGKNKNAREEKNQAERKFIISKPIQNVRSFSEQSQKTASAVASTKPGKPIQDDCLTYEMVQRRNASRLRKTIKETVRAAWRALGHDGYFRYDLRVRQIPCPGEKSKKPNLKALMKPPIPKRKDVYIIDVNPYCGLFGPPNDLDEADAILSASKGGLNHKSFTEHMIKLAIHREILRRLKYLRKLLEAVKRETKSVLVTKESQVYSHVSKTAREKHALLQPAQALPKNTNTPEKVEEPQASPQEA